jgi:hypothetical protein
VADPRPLPPSADPRSPGTRSPALPALVALAIAIVLVVILSPAAPIDGQGQVTTFSHERSGASGFFRTIERLGWAPERHIDLLRAPLATNAVYVVLEPPVPLTSTETTALLSAVREGAGLILAPGRGSPIGDSLRVHASRRRSYPLNGAESDSLETLSAEWSLDNLWDWPYAHLEIGGQQPEDSVTFIDASDPGAIRPGRFPVVYGIGFGEGRILILADAGLVRNARFRRTDAGVLPVRMLEWVTPAANAPVIFTEYHQGFGRHPSLVRTVRDALTRTSAGRMLAHFCIAALLLLMALGPRSLAPRARVRNERRSPLEHVDALARAYEQVGATRTASRRLLHGLARRRRGAGVRTGGMDAYLSSLAARFPDQAPDAELLRGVLNDATPHASLAEVGRAVANLERAMTK